MHRDERTPLMMGRSTIYFSSASITVSIIIWDWRARRRRSPFSTSLAAPEESCCPAFQSGIDVGRGWTLSGSRAGPAPGKAAALGVQPTLHEGEHVSPFCRPRATRSSTIPFNAFVHNLVTDDQVATPVRCGDHPRASGGEAGLPTLSFPAAALITAPDGAREMEMETTHPETGLPVRLFDTRRFNRVQQLQPFDLRDIELLRSGRASSGDASFPQTTIRWIYKFEMELPPANRRVSTLAHPRRFRRAPALARHRCHDRRGLDGAIRERRHMKRQAGKLQIPSSKLQRSSKHLKLSTRRPDR